MSLSKVKSDVFRKMRTLSFDEDDDEAFGQVMKEKSERLMSPEAHRATLDGYIKDDRDLSVFSELPQSRPPGEAIKDVDDSLADFRRPYYEYMRLCKLHNNMVNSAVATCLYVQSPLLKVVRATRFSELDLIPVVELLKLNITPFIKELDLSRLRLNAVASLIVAQIFTVESNISVVNLSHNWLRDDGSCEIVRCLRKNQNIVKLSLANNKITVKGAKVIADILKNKGLPRLQKLFLENNALQQDGVDSIANISENRGIICNLDGNHVLAEILNSITHLFGLLVAVLGGISMIIDARALDKSSFWAVTVYVISLCMMFASSTLYHSFFRLGKARDVFQKLDHCCIFTLIAGTYTPYLFKFVWSDHHPHSITGPILFYVIWGFAFVGILFSATRLRRYSGTSFRAYLGLLMGWMVMVSLKTLWERMPGLCFALLAGGGVWYSVGVPFYIKGQEVSLFHVLWHVCILFGASCHYASILMYVVWE